VKVWLRRRNGRVLPAVLTTMAVALAGWVIAVPAQAAGTSEVVRTLVSRLVIAAEVRTGYDRDLFPLWADADGDGCNTRFEVLIAEATTAPAIGSGCTLTGGRWYSYYDNAYWTAASDLDIDHLVPLAEAWDSGARDWTTDRRRDYANDLADARVLVAVTDNVNQSKGDRDPAEWMPSYADVTCQYLNEWVADKTRWRLSVDTAEGAKLTTLANDCPNTTIAVTYAF
jgi:hypothetical protein